ncbi:MAG: AI-2E family transporter [Myxococcales bacterium]|nr:AI-2E family transporter [Myxococcales bacterium]
MASRKPSQAARTLVIIASLFIITAGLKAAAPLLTPLLVSLFLAVLCIPPLHRLKGAGVPDGIAIVIVVIGATILVIAITAIIGRSLAGFESKLPEYRLALDGHVSEFFGWLKSRGIDANTEVLTSQVSSSAILELVTSLAGELLAALSQMLLVILTMIFMLLEASSVPSKLRRAMGSPDADLKDWNAAMLQVQKYVAMKAIVSLVTAALATIVTAAVGVDFPLLWGLIAFLFNFIPNIGSVIAAIPPVLLALVQFGLTSALIVAAGYFAINMVMGNIVEPKVMGRRLGLSTLVVFLSLVFWNWVWGPVGMVLSVPLTVIVKIILEHSCEFRGIAIMLGPESDEVAKA